MITIGQRWRLDAHEVGHYLIAQIISLEEDNCAVMEVIKLLSGYKTDIYVGSTFSQYLLEEGDYWSYLSNQDSV